MRGPQLTNELKHWTKGEPNVLRNQTCPYCGTPLTEKNHSKEHVIGRKFVPRGKLAGSWNLILRACLKCNSKKADLEDDLSAITMQPHAGGEHATDDPVLKKESGRKQGSISRRTGKRVRDSTEEVSIAGPVSPGVNFRMRVVAQPQPDEERAFRLARMQMTAFFYFITYDQQQQIGRWWTGHFMTLNAAFRADWGNDHQMFFMNAVVDWEPRVLAGVAQGYFRVAMCGAILTRRFGLGPWSGTRTTD